MINMINMINMVPNKPEIVENVIKDLEEEINEDLEESITLIQNLNRNLEHMNDMGKETGNISQIWSKFFKDIVQVKDRLPFKK